MLITAHALTGAFIGKEIGYPPLAFLAGIISHFLLDAIPHSDGPDDNAGKSENDPVSTGQYLVVAADIILAIIILVYFIQRHEASAGFIWGGIGGIFPDVVDNVPFWSHKLQKLSGFRQFHAFHYSLQSIKSPLWLGLVTQYAIAATFFWLLITIK